MLKIIASILALLSFSTLFAETYYVTGTVQSIEPVYSSTNIYTPETRCRNVKVPVYGKVVSGSGASGADVLGGMVFGALLGKALTNDNNAASVGAVMGGVVAAEQQKKITTKVIGYKTEQRCEVVQTVSQQSAIKDYRVIYSWNGFTGSSLTGRYYDIGSKIQIKVGLSLN